MGALKNIPIWCLKALVSVVLAAVCIAFYLAMLAVSIPLFAHNLLIFLSRGRWTWEGSMPQRFLAEAFVVPACFLLTMTFLWSDYEGEPF